MYRQGEQDKLPILILHPCHAAVPIGRRMMAEGNFKQMASLNMGGHLYLLKRQQCCQKSVIGMDEARSEGIGDIGFNPSERVVLTEGALRLFFHTLWFHSNDLTDVFIDGKQRSRA